MHGNTFDSFASMWFTAINDVLECGSDESRTGQLVYRKLGYCARLTNPLNNMLESNIRASKFEYIVGELAWYLTNDATLEQIEHYAPSYSNYCGASDYGFYGRRDLLQQLFEIVLVLKQHAFSRRAVISLWRREDLQNQHELDIPCTLTWQFTRDPEEGALNMITTMRSQDAWLGMINDVAVNTFIQVLVAKLIGCPVGWYQHQCGDLHIYDDHAVRAPDLAIPRSILHDGDFLWPCTTEDIHDFLKAEKEWREQGGMASDILVSNDTLLHYLLEQLI